MSVHLWVARSAKRLAQHLEAASASSGGQNLVPFVAARSCRVPVPALPEHAARRHFRLPTALAPRQAWLREVLCDPLALAAARRTLAIQASFWPE
jgi:hypothetical protein